mmetsp:Transcript_39465/g.91129  ORF Transcript_39465/g.91129 Transcript_39465/m.91129 type:complete len:217 (-) Transcript_39465:1328-1978(-)
MFLNAGGNESFIVCMIWPSNIAFMAKSRVGHNCSTKAITTSSSLGLDSASATRIPGTGLSAFTPSPNNLLRDSGNNSHAAKRLERLRAGLVTRSPSRTTVVFTFSDSTRCLWRNGPTLFICSHLKLAMPSAGPLQDISFKTSFIGSVNTPSTSISPSRTCNSISASLTESRGTGMLSTVSMSKTLFASSWNKACASSSMAWALSIAWVSRVMAKTV